MQRLNDFDFIVVSEQKLRQLQWKVLNHLVVIGNMKQQQAKKQLLEDPPQTSL